MHACIKVEGACQADFSKIGCKIRENLAHIYLCIYGIICCVCEVVVGVHLNIGTVGYVTSISQLGVLPPKMNACLMCWPLVTNEY